MPSPNAVFTELVSTTFRKHRKEVMDNVSKHNALYRLIAEGGRARTEDGGTSIAIPLATRARSARSNVSKTTPTKSALASNAVSNSMTSTVTKRATSLNASKFKKSAPRFEFHRPPRAGDVFRSIPLFRSLLVD